MLRTYKEREKMDNEILKQKNKQLIDYLHISSVCKFVCFYDKVNMSVEQSSGARTVDRGKLSQLQDIMYQ